MANLKKISKFQVGNLLKHNNREEDDGVMHSNETIDNELTHLNYYFKKGTSSDLHKIIRENQYYYADRKNSCPLIDAVVTLPENVKEEDEEAFFESVYDFYCKDFGEKNILNAVVHKDEVTPHIHIDFIPVREIDRANISPTFERLIKEEEERTGWHITSGISAREVITREYLMTMHPRLSAHIEKDLGYRTDILNGRTAGGNKSVMQLKNEFYQEKLDQLKEEVAKTEQEAEIAQKNIQIMTDKAKAMGFDGRFFDAAALLSDHERLIAERDLYRQALVANGITNIRVPKEIKDKLDKMPKVSGKFTYKSGIMVPDSSAITVIETYIEKQRPLPQQYLIDMSPTLQFMSNTLHPRDIRFLKAETEYLLFPTDSYEHTFRNLCRLKEKEDEITKLRMPKISNDIYNIAENILRQCNFETEYYYLEKQALEETVKDKENTILEYEDEE